MHGARSPFYLCPLEAEVREKCMKSEIIVILVMVALAVGGLVYLEMRSRRNKRREEQQSKSGDTD